MKIQVTQKLHNQQLKLKKQTNTGFHQSGT